jgi:hypothetical protein
LIAERDPYGHPRSIHNGCIEQMYDHTKPWVTHVSVQSPDVARVREWREAYGKPVIDDECEYEGNIPRMWGNISAQELVHRCWMLAVNGGYPGHGETYLHPADILWWSKGGVLHGESWPRIAFLRRIIEETAVHGLTPLDDNRTWKKIAAGGEGNVHFIYFGVHQPSLWPVGTPGETADYEVDVIDAWEMTVTRAALGAPPVSPPARGVPAGPGARYGVRLPGKPYMALRIKRLPGPPAGAALHPLRHDLGRGERVSTTHTISHIQEKAPCVY